MLKENEFFIQIARFITAILLLIAIAKLPYGYYTFLRLFVFVVGLISFFEFIQKKHLIALVFFSISILFNPFIPIHLDKAIWIPIDIITSIIFFVSLIIRSKEVRDK